jgi:hypothetical protein
MYRDIIMDMKEYLVLAIRIVVLMKALRGMKRDSYLDFLFTRKDGCMVDLDYLHLPTHQKTTLPPSS